MLSTGILDCAGKVRPAGSSYRNRIRSHFSGESSPASVRSLSVTPGRKISASAFEASGLRWETRQKSGFGGWLIVDFCKASALELTSLRWLSDLLVGRNILVRTRNERPVDMETAGGKMTVERPLKLWLCEREMEIERLLFVKREEHKQSCKLYILDQNRTRIIPYFPSLVNNLTMW